MKKHTFLKEFFDNIANNLSLFVFVVIAITPSLHAQDECLRSTEGTEFWFGFTEQRYVTGGDAPLISITITSRNNSDYELFFNNNPVPLESGTLNANTSVTFTYSSGPNTGNRALEQYVNVGSDTIQNKGFQLITTTPVNLYIYSYIRNSSDAAVIYPTNSVGKDYYVMSYTPDNDQYRFVNNNWIIDPNKGANAVRGKNSQFIIVAHEDATEVNISPTVLVDGRANMDPYTITLQKGQIYQAQSENIVDAVDQGDLTGTFISSNKNISLISGNHGTRVPYFGPENPDIGFWDILIEQIPPITSWGTIYPTAPLSLKTRDFYRIMAAQDSTNIVVSATGQTFNINAGEFVEAILYEDEPSTIEANKPILVAQFASSFTDGTDILESYNNRPDNINRIGDPFMILLSPINQSKDDVTFSVITSPNVINYFVNVLTLTSNVNNILLDGVNVGANFAPIPSAPIYSFAQISLTTGEHRLQSLNPEVGFLAYNYGFSESGAGNTVESYGYGVGFNINYSVIIGHDGNIEQLVGDTLWHCPDDSDGLTLSPLGFMDSYEWFKDGQPIVSNAQSTLNTSGNGWYKVIGTVVTETATCTAVDSIYVITLEVEIGADDIILCPGEDTLVSVPDIYESYLWSTGSTNSFTTLSTSANHTVTVTSNGCTATDNVLLDAEDLIDPVITCQDAVVQLDNNGNGSVNATALISGATDNCAPFNEIVPVTSVFNFDCDDLGDNVIQVEFRDGAGNTATCSSTITIEDNIDPTASNPPTKLFECIEDITTGGSTTDEVTTEADNCTTPPTVTFVGESDNGGTGCPTDIYILTKTYRIEDESRNFIEVQQTWQASDATPPTASNPPDVILECIEDLPDPDASVVSDAADNCLGDVIITHLNDVTSGSCPTTIVRTYRVADKCDNGTTVTQTFIINDVTPPSLTCPTNITVSNDPGQPYAEVTIGQPVISDNCIGTVTLVNDYNNTDDASDRYFASASPNIITWTGTDECGNESTCQMTVVVTDSDAPELTCFDTPNKLACIDELPPVIQNFDEFRALGGDATDNNGIDESSFRLDTTFTDGGKCPETIIRTYAISDLNGSTGFCVQQYIIHDTIPPTASNPNDIFVDVIANIPAASTAVVTDEADNCGVAFVEHISDVSDGQKCPETITRTYQVSDSCDNTIQVFQRIIVNNAPDAYTLDPDQIEICEGDSAELFVNGDYTTIEWNTGETTDTIYVLETGWFKPLVDGCDISDSIEIVYTQLPTPSFTNQFDQACYNGSARVFASPNNSAYEYEWLEGINSTLVSQTLNEAIFDLTPNSYATIGMVYKVGECVSDTIWEDDVRSSFTFDYRTDADEGCSPFEVTFTGISNSGMDDLEYQWFINDVSLNVSRTGNTYVHTFTEAGEYKIEVVASSTITGCTQSVSDSSRILVYPIPIADFEVDDEDNPNITFDNLSVNGSIYVWKYGNGIVDTILQDTMTSTSHIYRYFNGGVYTVELETYSTEGCSDTARLEGLVIKPVFPFMPNAIHRGSPLEQNRFFLPIENSGGIDPTTFLFTVYSRWGEEIFATRDFNKSWDGTLYNGNLAELGAYVFTVVYKDFDGGEYEHNGQIVVVK